MKRFLVFAVLVISTCGLGTLLLWAGVRQTALDEELVEVSYKGYSWKIGDLIRDGANPNAKLEGNITPIIMAATNGHDAAVRELLRFGADPYLKDDEGRNAFDCVQRQSIPSLQEWLTDPMGRK